LLSSDAELLFNHPPTQNTQNTLSHSLSLSLKASFSSCTKLQLPLQLKQQFFLLVVVVVVVGGTTKKHFAYKATKAFRVLPVIFLLMTWL
jgi:hypothetical protein